MKLTFYLTYKKCVLSGIVSTWMRNVGLFKYFAFVLLNICWSAKMSFVYLRNVLLSRCSNYLSNSIVHCIVLLTCPVFYEDIFEFLFYILYFNIRLFFICIYFLGMQYCFAPSTYCDFVLYAVLVTVYLKSYRYHRPIATMI